MKLVISTFTIGVACLSLAHAAEAPSSLIADSKANDDLVTRYVLASAEKMPEENCAFRPSPDVRTFAQLLAHRELCAAPRAMDQSGWHTDTEQ